jgi:tRNA uridine 5-carboxymethylaminomethyl modification enzyme
LDEVRQALERTKVTGAMAERIEFACSPPRLSQLSKSRGAFVASGTDLSSAVGQPLAQLLKRPEITIEQLAPVLTNLLPEFFERSSSVFPVSPVVKLSSEIRNELKSVETEIKYAGYLDQQQRAIDRLKKAEQRRIPDWFDYQAVSGLSREMQETLGRVVPRRLGKRRGFLV